LQWLYRNADTLGVDRARISVMGESAGGGHAAMLAIAARDRGEISLHHQILTYPMLDDRTGSTRHVKPWVGRHIWTESDNRFGWASLLGVPAGSATVPQGSVPARVDNLKGLPATFIAVGALDLFVDENIAYAQRLLDAGVPTELLVVPGAFHAFDGLAPTSSIAQRFTAAIDWAIARACT
ncbi:MAG TPA: alpha/beta hydrolase fold domain-containing protein, partial [Spongiibacteraceae bacterium]|nr:alpha/beta hydrolase fold domain-containing protein [Spongiibacteraceae bacterium]